jgi:translation initiation factor IF-2
MTDSDKTEKKKSTLSIGGTLSIGDSGKSDVTKSGVSVEVKRRRFNTPQSGKGENALKSSSGNSELDQRLKALEKSKENEAQEEQIREEERKRTEELRAFKAQKDAESQEKEDTRKALESAKDREVREKEEAEAARKEEERQKQELAEQQAAATTAEQKGPSKRFTAEDFTGKKKGTKAPSTSTASSKKRGGRNAYVENLETRMRTMPGSRRYKMKKGGSDQFTEKVIRDVIISDIITVQELANRMSEKVGDVVKKLMLMGQMVTQNQSIDQETAALIVEEFGHTYKLVNDNAIEEDLAGEADKKEELSERPPVVTVMGHVDHGKTSLLDALRKTHVADGEAGGITQHIGAYQIRTESGRLITFLDTPGHEAFTSMRARGASVTDIVILIVAADDGIMPQTIEAIRHAKAAEVPIIVAINKCDKPEANPERVKQELLTHDLVPEDFGGDIVCCEISAKTGTGLEHLEEMILLQADVLELKANSARRADGVVVESRLDKGRGPIASIIVNRGTLRVGDVFVAGSVWGRVRAMMDDKGNKLDEAGPARPLEIQGLQSVCDAGDTFQVASNDRRAREVAAFREQKKREKAMIGSKASLESLFSKIAEGEVVKLSVVVKGDVQGSVEAITDVLNKLATDVVKVQVIHGAVGVITENDVNLASASDALILGFNVRANAQARAASEREGIEIRYYSVIYSLVDDVKAALTGLLSPEYEEKILGRAEIRQIMLINKFKICGCYVTEGKLTRNGKVRIIRDGVVVHEGAIDTLRRFKDDVKEVAENYECGMTFANYDDLKEGDEIETFEMIEIKRTLEDVKKAQNEKEARAKVAKEEADLQALLEAEA